MRLDEGKRGVVADRTDVAKMIGYALEFCQHSADRECARTGTVGVTCATRKPWKMPAHRRLRYRRKPALPVCTPRPGSRPGHQRLDPLVHISKTLFQPHDRLAIGGEAEVAWLNNAGMDRSYRNLMQAFLLGLGRNE